MDKVAKTIVWTRGSCGCSTPAANGDMRARRKVNEDAAMMETIRAAARLAGYELPTEYQA